MRPRRPTMRWKKLAGPYFGNAVGETGNNSSGATPDAVVDAADESAVRAHKSGFAPVQVTNPYDFNHDRRVSASRDLTFTLGQPRTCTVQAAARPSSTRAASPWQ